MATISPPERRRGQAPRDELTDAGDSPGGDDVGLDLAPEGLRLAAVDRHVLQAELLDGALEPGDAALERLDEMEVQIGARDGEHEAGQSGARADVGDRRPFVDEITDDDTV